MHANARLTKRDALAVGFGDTVDLAAPPAFDAWGAAGLRTGFGGGFGAALTSGRFADVDAPEATALAFGKSAAAPFAACADFADALTALAAGTGATGGGAGAADFAAALGAPAAGRTAFTAAGP